MDLQPWLDRAVAAVRDWEQGFGAFSPHPSAHVSDERFAAAFGELAGRLRDNYPYFHPSYAGQMLKPPHPAAVAGYLAAMLINPNNHALDGGPATSAMEKEAVAELAAMFGFAAHLGHLTSSGTIAVDPHKHGLQPYGCGAVLFADPSVGRLYRHDSPYTYGRARSGRHRPQTPSQPRSPAIRSASARLRAPVFWMQADR